MATVDQTFADNLVKNNGYYNGDSRNSYGDNPRAVMITKYLNSWGAYGYGVTFEGQENKYIASPFVRDPQNYWTYKGD